MNKSLLCVDAREAVQVFHVLAPQNSNQRSRRHHPKQTAVGIHHRHGGKVLLDRQRRDPFLIFIGVDHRGSLAVDQFFDMPFVRHFQEIAQANHAL
jgi:hypothetical protein